MKKPLKGGTSDIPDRHPVEVRVEAKSPGQRQVLELWPRSRILFLIGEAGCGKSHLSLGLALKDILSHPRDNGRKPRLLLTRPMVSCDEEIGLLPGTVEEKLGPWLGPFHDVLGQLSHATWDELRREVDIELVPVGMLRGRTVSNGFLIADECQDLSHRQLKCLLTRVGRNGRLILCGDPTQSELHKDPKKVPLVEVARRLEKLDPVSVVRFTKSDQVRDPLVSDVLDLLS